VFNSIEITAVLLYLTQCRYIYTWCAMERKGTNPQRFERKVAITYAAWSLL